MRQPHDIRPAFYVVALVLGLIALFVMLTGDGWTAFALALAAMAVIAGAERLAELRLREAGARAPEACR